MSRTIGDVIKERREDKGLTQAQLAQKVGKTRGFLANLENNHTSSSFETLKSVVKALS